VMRPRLNENLLFSFAGLGAVSAFFGAVILWSVARGGFSLVSFWGVAGFSFFILGLLAVGYSVYLSGRPATVLSVALLIFVGGFLSNMAYDFSARSRDGNSYSFQVVSSDGVVYNLGPKSFALLSTVPGENLGSSCQIRFDARLRVTDPPGSLPLPSFTVDRTMYVKLVSSSVYGKYVQATFVPVAPYVHYPGSSTQGWEYSSDGSVARCQTGSMTLESFSVSVADSSWD